jgi:hypothetical protein
MERKNKFNNNKPFFTYFFNEYESFLIKLKTTESYDEEDN